MSTVMAIAVPRPDASAPDASPSGAPPVAATGISIRYGRRLLLGPLDLRVAAGEVYALLGRNGSGKSSLVRVLLGLQRGDGGEVRLLGRDPWRHRREVLADVGFVPEEPQAPPEMTPRQLVAFCGRLRRRWDGAGALERLERFGVALDRAFGRLSKGQRKQVELALALAHRPALLVLDDPSLGLDPLARRALFGELMAELAEQGTTVLLTTHDLEAVEGVATRVGVLADGRLLVDEPLDELRARFRRLRVPPARERDLAALVPIRRDERPWGVEVVVSEWREQGAPGLEAHPMSLEEIFSAVHAGPTEVER
jgi:ABC-2 type transport system ATP-binding protein